MGSNARNLALQPKPDFSFREALFLLFFWIGGFLFLYATSLCYFDSVGDEGFLVAGIQRQMQYGDLPGIDFFSLPFLNYTLPCMLMKWLGIASDGPVLYGYRLFCALLISMGATCVVACCRLIAPRKIGGALIAGFLLLLFPGLWAKSMVLMMLACTLLLVLLYLEKPVLPWVLLMALWCGIGYGLKYEFFVLEIALCMLVFFLKLKQSPAKLWKTIFVFLGFTFLTIVGLVWFNFGARSPEYLRYLMKDYASEQNVSRYLLQFSFPPVSLQMGKFIWLWWWASLLIPPVCFFVFLRKKNQPKREMLMVLSFAAMMVGPYVFSIYSYSRCLHAFVPFYLLIFAVYAIWNPVKSIFRSLKCAGFVLVVTLFILDLRAYGANPGFGSYVGTALFLPRHDFIAISHIRCRPLLFHKSTLKDVDGFLGFGQKHKGEMLLPITYNPFVNYFTGMRNPTPFSAFCKAFRESGLVNTEEVIASAEKHRIQCINAEKYIFEDSSRRLERYDPKLYQYLNDHFVQADSFGGQIFFVRKPPNDKKRV